MKVIYCVLLLNKYFFKIHLRIKDKQIQNRKNVLKYNRHVRWFLYVFFLFLNIIGFMNKTIKKKIINYILKNIENHHILSKRKYKHSNRTIVNLIVSKYDLGMTWRNIKYCTYRNHKIPYNTVYDRYKSLVKYDIIKKAHENILNDYCVVINNNVAYIDSTAIINKYGYKIYTSYNNYIMRKHRSCKLSIICTSNKIPISCYLSSSNIHDNKLIYDTLPKTIFFKYLCGDKAYRNAKLKKDLFKKHNIHLVASAKKNEHIQNTEFELGLLKNRTGIEHINKELKDNNQIQTRYYKRNDTFLSHIYIGFMKITLEKL